MTLHEAMIVAINGLGGGQIKLGDVADYINKNKLYHRKDKLPVPVNQISARLDKYKHLFGRKDGYIWIK